MIKTEFKKRLAKLSDEKIKKMAERVDIHPFPVILLQEYAKRFDSQDTKKQVASMISKRLAKEKLRQKKILREIKTQTRKLVDCDISQTGLKMISATSVDAIHQKATFALALLQRSSGQLLESSKKIMQYEKLLKSLYKRA